MQVGEKRRGRTIIGEEKKYLQAALVLYIVNKGKR